MNSVIVQNPDLHLGQKRHSYKSYLPCNASNLVPKVPKTLIKALLDYRSKLKSLNVLAACDAKNVTDQLLKIYMTFTN